MSRHGQDSREVQKAMGMRIRDLRAKKDWSSQEAFANACGIHRAHLGEIERGKLDITLSTVARIAKTLNITVSKLFQGIA